MLRTFRIATLSAVMTVAACKTSDRPAAPPPAPAVAAKPVPAARPTPADPAAKPASPAATEATTEAARAELQTRAVAMMQQMGDMFSADGKDCEKLAADLRSFVADNQGALSRIEAMQQQASEDERAAFSTRMQAVQAQVATKMQGTLTACASSPSVLAAMKQFPAEHE